MVTKGIDVRPTRRLTRRACERPFVAENSIPILRQAQLCQHDAVPLHEFARIRIAHVLRCELVFGLPQALGTEVGLAALPNTRVT